MIKKMPYGANLKEQLLANARDKLHRFLLLQGTVRGAIVHGTRMVNEMRANHELGILETLVLGHGYLAGALMCTGLKGDERITLQIGCSGPIKGLLVEANAFGEVRGYLKNVPIPIDKPLEDFNLSPFFGAGILSVTKVLRDAKQPFTGQVELLYGNIAKDLAYYYLTSEQNPTAFNLSVKFDREGKVTGSGGLFLQVMPGAEESDVDRLEALVSMLPSIGAAFAEGEDPEELVRKSFKTLDPRFLGAHRVEFMCRCNQERVEEILTTLPKEDLDEMIQNGPFPLEVKCHYCNTPYLFNKDALLKIESGKETSEM